MMDTATGNERWLTAARWYAETCSPCAECRRWRPGRSATQL